MLQKLQIRTEITKENFWGLKSKKPVKPRDQKCNLLLNLKPDSDGKTGRKW